MRSVGETCDKDNESYNITFLSDSDLQEIRTAGDKYIIQVAF